MALFMARLTSGLATMEEGEVEDIFYKEIL